jgi:hypothetical protein
MPAVGLDSGMKAADFKRKQLNLVILLDISGSMGEAFNQYYYDANGTQQQLSEAGAWVGWLGKGSFCFVRHLLASAWPLLPCLQDSLERIQLTMSKCLLQVFSPKSITQRCSWYSPGIKME